MGEYPELEQAVIDLHNSARAMEQAFGGQGKLSIETRRIADRLAEIISPIPQQPISVAKGDQ